ncbi:hypothetical protein FB459_3169 [Yimella lutea]|uniref:Uncharacterized protein n=1 Tax=Yimella lutea TaxID=587872 RepID=A0A542EJU6_9MICO|nr:hypothetical protein FB459_3169 [Yimella lutea]
MLMITREGFHNSHIDPSKACGGLTVAVGGEGP